MPRDAQHALAVRLQERLALGVVRAGEGVVVPRGAVRFDDEPLPRPAEVGHHPTAVEHERFG
jgi:hypothetical protein